MNKSKYTVYVTWPDGTQDKQSFPTKASAVTYQIMCIKKGASTTITQI